MVTRSAGNPSEHRSQLAELAAPRARSARVHQAGHLVGVHEDRHRRVTRDGGLQPGQVRIGRTDDNVDRQAQPDEAGDRARRDIRAVRAAEEHEDAIDATIALAAMSAQRGELRTKQRVSRPGQDPRRCGTSGRHTDAAPAPRFWLRTRSTGSGRSARSSMAMRTAPGTRRRMRVEPLAAEAVVVAHDQRGAGSDAFGDRVRLGLDRRSARQPDDLDPDPDKPGRQAVDQVAGHDGRPPAASHEPFGQRARTDEVSGADRHGRIGADHRVTLAHERSPAGGTTFWATSRLIETHDGWSSTTASASRQPKSSRPIAS